MKIHGFDAVDKVEHIHGYLFTRTFLRHSVPSDGTTEAYGDSGIARYLGDEGAAHDRYEDIEDEIVVVTFARAQRAIIEAFVTTANEVLERERKRSNV